MKKIVVLLAVVFCTCGNCTLQAQLHNPAHMYDTVTDADTFYYFSLPKPCITPMDYWGSPIPALAQEYVTNDTLTVYGVAITCDNWSYYTPLDVNNANINRRFIGLLLKRIGISPINIHVFSFSLLDSVSFYRSRPHFCWFRYEDDCNKTTLTTPCYEFYFDSPAQINRVTDTFYVGYNVENTQEGEYPTVQIAIQPFGGEYSTAYRATIYQGSFGIEGIGLDYFLHRDYGVHNRKWGVAFPIIGFRCGAIKQYWLESYTGNSATVRWRSTEDSTIFNVRLVGEDGSDITYDTYDTVFTFTHLSDSVRYNVMLRKQCHYATSNYDTTVHSEWLSHIHFGTTILPTVWRTVTVSSDNPHWGFVSGGGTYADSSVASLNAHSFDGYAFDAWNDSITDNPRHVMVVSDTSFSASFREADDTTGISQPAAGDFVLRPNPAKGIVQILLPQSARGGMLSLCDLSGRQLEVRMVTDSTLEWDLSFLPAGVYLVKLVTTKGSSTHKLQLE